MIAPLLIRFDLFCLKNDIVKYGETYTMDSQVVCAVYKNNNPSAYYLYPRSSISKTPLRLANSVGIIDSGYRGNLGGFFDIQSGYQVGRHDIYEQYQRLVQICSNTLEPFKVILVDDIDKLGTTERGEGGFGSTGV